MREDIISDGRWKYTYRETVNEVHVDVSFEQDQLSMTPVQVNYRDFRQGDLKWMTVFNPRWYLDTVIRSLHLRRFDRARIFADSKSESDVDNRWLRAWQEKRCLHLGLPNHASMLLLMGLTKRINSTYRQTKSGAWVPDGTISKLNDAKLISGLQPIPKKRRAGFMTNERGYSVLLHWSENRKGFKKFFDAYCPKDWERDHLANQVFEKMTGDDDPFIPL